MSEELKPRRREQALLENYYGQYWLVWLPWASKQSIARIHPITVNNGIDQTKQDAAIEFLTYLYAKEHYTQLLMDCLDVIPAYDVGDLSEYYNSLTWSEGYKDVTLTTPVDMVGDFIFNNQELGQIVITHVQDVLTGSASVEDAMAAAQSEAEELAALMKSDLTLYAKVTKAINLQHE